MPAGYLWVMAEPGKQATVEEFNGERLHLRARRHLLTARLQTGTMTSTFPSAWRSTSAHLKLLRTPLTSIRAQHLRVCHRRSLQGRRRSPARLVCRVRHPGHLPLLGPQIHPPAREPLAPGRRARRAPRPARPPHLRDARADEPAPVRGQRRSVHPHGCVRDRAEV